MITRRLLATALCTIALFACVANVGAQELGGRAFGMGGAYVAISDDIASLVYNPAGLPNSSFEVGIGLGSSDLGAITQFQSLLGDPSSFSGEASIDIATLSGVSIGGFGVGFAAQGSLAVSEGCAGFDLCGEGDYMTQIILGYGRTNVAAPLKLFGLQAGFNVKRLDGRRIDFTKTHPAGGAYEIVTDNWTGQGYSLSLGAQLKASDIITLGFAANDVVSSLTWEGTRTSSTYLEANDELDHSSKTNLGQRSEQLDRVYRFGVAVKPPFLGVTLAADSGSDGSVRYGLEKDLLFGALKVRFGGIRSAGTATTTAGLGVHLGPVRLDVAAGSTDGFQTVSTMIEGSVRF